jgi:hypothetical protein
MLFPKSMTLLLPARQDVKVTKTPSAISVFDLNDGLFTNIFERLPLQNADIRTAKVSLQ